MKIATKITPATISLIKILLISRLSFTDFLKYSLKISSTTPKITANIPPKIKKENGIKEILQMSSLKPSAKTKDTTKTCFLFFRPVSSPSRRNNRKIRQKVKKIKNTKIAIPLKKLMA